MVPAIAQRQMRHAAVVPHVASGAAGLSSCGSMKPGLCIGAEEESSWCLLGSDAEEAQS